MVGDDVACCLEPEVGDLVERLSLERHRPEEPIKCRHAVSGDDRANVAGRVAIANFPLVRQTKVLEVCLVQCPVELALNSLVGNHLQFPLPVPQVKLDDLGAALA